MQQEKDRKLKWERKIFNYMLMEFKMSYLKMCLGNLSRQQNQKVIVSLLLPVSGTDYKIMALWDGELAHLLN